MMSVLRRMMLWSASWNTSTRSRPRSFAALQAISALASPCARRFLRFRRQLGDAHADRDLHRAVAARVGELGALAPHHVADLLREVERAVGQEHREAVARDARRERARPRLLAQHLGDLADQLVADVHAEVVVDDVHAVDVHVQHAFRRRLLASGELAADLGFERGAREQRRQRVEVVRRARSSSCAPAARPGAQCAHRSLARLPRGTARGSRPRARTHGAPACRGSCRAAARPGAP